MRFVVGTDDGVGVVENGSAPRLIGLQGRHINHVAAHGDVIYAAVPHDGLYRVHEEDSRRLWEGDARSCAASPDGALYVGVEPAMVYRSRDGGESWERLSAIDSLPTRDEWTFPPPPHEPHVLSIDFLPDAPQTVVAGVEVGGALWSHDGGDTWEERNEGIYVDVHSLRPGSAPGTLFAVTGAGFYATDDGGEHWERRMNGIGNGYTIGLAPNPGVAGDVFVAAGVRPPGVDARLYRSGDGGQHWSDMPSPEASLHGRAPVPFFMDGAPHIGMANGAICRFDEHRNEWTEVCTFPAGVTCVHADGSPSSVMH